MIHRNVIAKFSARSKVVGGTSDWIFPGTRPYAKSAQQIKIAAAFMRGGTSKAIVFHRRDLPAVALWDEVFLAVNRSTFLIACSFCHTYHMIFARRPLAALIHSVVNCAEWAAASPPSRKCASLARRPIRKQTSTTHLHRCRSRRRWLTSAATAATCWQPLDPLLLRKGWFQRVMERRWSGYTTPTHRRSSTCAFPWSTGRQP